MRVALDTNNEARAIELARELLARPVSDLLEIGPCQFEIDAYLEARKRAGLSENWITSQRYVLQSFVQALDVTTPQHISHVAIQKWLSKSLTKQAHTAVAYFAIISRWFRWLHSSGKLPINPAIGIKAPKLSMRVRRNFLLPDQARLLLKNCQDEGLKFAIYCGLHAGLRKEEVIEARPSWFDLDANLLHLQATESFQPKDRDNRTIPLTDEFKLWLIKKYPLRSPFMLAPEVEQGKYRYRFDFRRAFGTLAKKCGFTELTFHDLRRTFASVHVSAGVSIYKVARWMGDRVDVVEAHYGHLVPNDAEINVPWKKAKGAAASPKGRKKKRQSSVRKLENALHRHKPLRD